MKKILLVIFLFPLFSFAQETVEGIVKEEGTNTPLLGANVYWLGTEVGVVTNFDGEFSIPYKKSYKKLVVSYVGFSTDTLIVNNPKNKIDLALSPTSNLDEVNVVSKKKATSRSYIDAKNVINISSDELLKAACCNLSESFETNPSIDVNFADAISGTRQIKMLGLTSPYILIAMENIPTVRGASQAYGLTFTPGTWVESIQITKGAGSVVNGYESIAGQINAELQKPTKDNKFFLNVYGASSQRVELNTHYNTKVSEKWSTGIYLHGNSHQEKHDVNHDNFLDMPMYHQINLMNRWQYTDNENGIVGFFNLRVLNDHKQTGELDFDPDTDKLTTNAWGSEIDTQRYDFSSKIGYVNPDLPWQNMGLQFAVSHHNQESYFGLRNYDIEHNSIYSNFIYSSIISDSRHKIKTGLSFTYDEYDEQVQEMSYQRKDNSVGSFFEYNFDNLEKVNLTAGLRADYHNRLGFFLTPRVHVKYTPWEKSAFRASIGRGKRIANIFAENQSLFSTNRSINILGASEGGTYGLDPEIAWNYGVSYLQGFNLFNRKADVTVDFYRTDFTNQVVVDWENAQQVSFYNLEHDSYANSFQTEVNYNAFERFDIRLAYKYYDIKTKYLSGEKIKPLTAQHRFFTNLSYDTEIKNNSMWKFDVTCNWLGKQRFSSTAANSVEFQLPNYSPEVNTINAQVTKVFSPKFEIYVGGENITNVRQDRPILGTDNPFGSTFDSTFVYGPIFGSLYYAGLRYKIK
ncbi:Outer membrane receptor for ferrienterochelin and colicins [Mesonia phycicola]|uniref:Outer membrane receptor for ferrienterochelin and colicins n=1 Tax=Mesonia phycicola TaxID=579105 RepID=A0A1M6AJD5_9FLAO|nr:TonB-dependent receptor [Mesonia phycicola]SHI36555.1 Outer membrane receptor for ferrienterochelin and colicins [Mesonia phycicola]